MFGPLVNPDQFFLSMNAFLCQFDGQLRKCINILWISLKWIQQVSHSLEMENILLLKQETMKDIDHLFIHLTPFNPFSQISHLTPTLIT